MGTIYDRRPKAPRPCFDYLITLPTSTLKDMWVGAIKRQIEDLVAHEVREAPVLLLLRLFLLFLLCGLCVRCFAMRA